MNWHELKPGFMICSVMVVKATPQPPKILSPSGKPERSFKRDLRKVPGNLRMLELKAIWRVKFKIETNVHTYPLVVLTDVHAGHRKCMFLIIGVSLD